MNQKLKNVISPLLFIIVFTVFFHACTSNHVADTQPTAPTAEIEIEAVTDNTVSATKADTVEETPPEPNSTIEITEQSNSAAFSETPFSDNEVLTLYFFDVGQADCTLIKVGERAMLIDAGDVGQDSLVLEYLSKYGVNKLDYIVASHPHADHIGAMAAVVRTMDSIGELLMPDAIHTTGIFNDLLDAIEEKEILITIPKPGDTFAMGKAKIQVLAPNSEQYDELNNYSLVLRVEYGQTSFLLTGDAEDISEREQLQSGLNLNADILKVGHHGSNSSTTLEYLAAISPDYAVISCGKDNPYGHPDNKVLSRLTECAGAVFRTDENGTVIFTSDGQTITAKAENEAISEIPEAAALDIDKSSEELPSEQADSIGAYIGNKNSKIFHLPSCSTLPVEKNRIYFSTREEAVGSNMRPCKRCNP